MHPVQKNRTGQPWVKPGNDDVKYSRAKRYNAKRPALIRRPYMFAMIGVNRQDPARALSMKSGRSAFFQSGIAAIFFSFSSTSACPCR